ncbi:unnamed protein product [Sphenostylis stenocarpa]|uniref:Uncharacterized protein n=1 Tax=Sphenostylis stenocarpa TaxID=92480 RepID=A0AA86VER0_9FABA|nr:unnamed protein product [Sphenostylis stenocarpa]
MTEPETTSAVEKNWFFQDIRKTVLMMKDIAVQLEKDKHFDKDYANYNSDIKVVGRYPSID